MPKLKRDPANTYRTANQTTSQPSPHLLATALTLLIVVSLAGLGLPSVAAASNISQASRSQADSGYQAPTRAAVLVHFSANNRRWLPGSRTVTYATGFGSAVVAPKEGLVSFAGPVAGRLWVTIDHPDGLRSSLGPLALTGLRRGEHIDKAALVGYASGPLQFSIRAKNAYLDPEILIEGTPDRARLVPRLLITRHDAPSLGMARFATAPPTKVSIRPIRFEPISVDTSGWLFPGNWLNDSFLGFDASASGHDNSHRPGLLRRSLGAALSTSRWVSAKLEFAAGIANPGAALGKAFVSVTAQGALQGFQQYFERRLNCTAQDVAPPVDPNRITIVVPGLNSHSKPGDSADFGIQGGIAGVDPTLWGRDPAKTFRYSYGNNLITDDSLEMTEGHASSDTQISIRDSAEKLREYVDYLATKYPDTPIDIVAHSQGGLVSLVALTDLGLDAKVSKLVTLSSPLIGSSAADVGNRLSSHGEIAANLAEKISGVPSGAAVLADLPMQGWLVNSLRANPYSPATQLTTIAAAGDIIVPTHSTSAGRPDSVVGLLDPRKAHNAIQTDSTAMREVRLALAGLPPRCVSLVESLRDFTVGNWVSSLEQALGRVG